MNPLVFILLAVLFSGGLGYVLGRFDQPKSQEVLTQIDQRLTELTNITGASNAVYYSVAELQSFVRKALQGE